MALDLPVLHNTFGNYFAWLVVFSLPWIFFYPTVIRWTIKPKKLRLRWDLSMIIYVLCLVLTTAWARTHTGQGLLILKGARPWVIRAEEAKNPEDAKAILRWIQESGQYGVNAADDAVRALPDPRERVRMYRLLSDCAINDGWRDMYLDMAEREEAKLPATRPASSAAH